MMCYSLQRRDRIFVKSNEILSFAKIMGKCTGKNKLAKEKTWGVNTAKNLIIPNNLLQMHL